MLMEMPFVKTVVTAPFRWAQSERTELANYSRVSLTLGAPEGGYRKPVEDSKKAGDHKTVWTGQAPRYAC